MALDGDNSFSLKPASKEEVESFASQNKRFLPEDAEQVLRGMSPIDQRRVISAGTMSSCRDPTAVIQARVRKAREMEAQIGRGAGAAEGGGKAPSELARAIVKPAARGTISVC